MANVSTTTSHGSSRNETHSEQTSRSRSESTSESRKFLDEELLASILGGLTGQMSDEQIRAYAENLLKPQLNAGLEAAQHNYETTRLGKQQEMDNLAQSLSAAIAEQQSAYRRSMTNVETAALARGMGRSSYTLQTLAGQGDALAKAVGRLTDEHERKRSQLQSQITLAAQQNAQTQGRLQTDFAASLAARQQELAQTQRQQYNQNYLTAVSGALGTRTFGSQTTEGSSQTHSQTTGRTSSSSTTVTRRR